MGDFVKQEDIFTEYKELLLFKIPCNLFLKKEEINMFLDNGLFTPRLQKLVDLNIKEYIKLYIPKYISCFANSGINGTLTFGISDMGEFTGIPSSKPINPKKIKNLVNKTIDKYVKCENIKNKTIKKNINISVKKLNIDIDILEKVSLDEIFSKVDECKSIIRKSVNIYQKKKNMWLDEMDLYRSLLKILTSQPQYQELKDYIIKNHQDNLKKAERIIQHMNKENIKELPNYDLLQKLKVNRDSYFYWLVKFKDYKIEEICSRKPINNISRKTKKYSRFIEGNKPSILLGQLTKMRHYLISNNPNLLYYIIQFDIKGSNLKTDLIKYRLPGSDWEWRTRVMNDNGPGCCMS